MESVYEGAVSADSARQTVSKMRELSTSCLELFNTFFDPDHYCWPYALNDGSPIEPEGHISTSTVAMILHACSISDGHVQKSVLAPANRSWKPAKTEEISAVIGTASPILFDACRSRSPEDLLHSTTWGKNDPLTLLWLYELLVASDPATTADLKLKVVEAGSSRIRGAFTNPNAPILDVNSGAISHVFPLLRLVQLKCAIESNEGAATKSLQDISTEPSAVWFETQLHKQLSLSAIPNSEFDPASLIFALEGLLLIAPHRVGNLVVTRTLKVMHESARTGSYWRPVRPLRTTAQGYVLLPQSVEVANSLLRICSIRNEDGGKTEWQPLVLEALQNYREWLEGRLTSGLTAPSTEYPATKEFVGWQSDHTHTDGQVHLWATSQALLFCEHYGAFMQQHLARSLQAETGVKSSAPLVKSLTWAKLSEREPLKNLPSGSANRAYDRIYSTIIGPRIASGTSDSSSVLLYGPPGTGKTTFVEQVAKALDYDLIRITPSDFIQSGEAGVEERARRIFEMLMEQSKTVVLFDEIDNLLLARDSKRYSDQSEMFQFMTPSMLIKLKGLLSI